MKIEIETGVEIPEGYEAISVGKLNEGDLFLDAYTGVQEWKHNQESSGYYIKLNKIERWREITIDEVAEIIQNAPSTRCRFGGVMEGLLRGFRISDEGIHQFMFREYCWYSKCEVLINEP